MVRFRRSEKSPDKIMKEHISLAEKEGIRDYLKKWRLLREHFTPKKLLPKNTFAAKGATGKMWKQFLSQDYNDIEAKSNAIITLQAYRVSERACHEIFRFLIKHEHYDRIITPKELLGNVNALFGTLKEKYGLKNNHILECLKASALAVHLFRGKKDIDGCLKTIKGRWLRNNFPGISSRDWVFICNNSRVLTIPTEKTKRIRTVIEAARKRAERVRREKIVAAERRKRQKRPIRRV